MKPLLIFFSFLSFANAQFAARALAFTEPRDSKIKFISSSSAVADTVTMPPHKVGDTIIVFAGNRSSTTIPTMPSGYTNVVTRSEAIGVGVALRIAYKVATSNSETTGTWTNAQTTSVCVYQGVSGIGASTTNANNVTAISFPAITLNVTNGSSWVGMFGVTNRSAESISLSGLTTREQINTSPSMYAGDTNGGVASITAKTYTQGGTNRWVTATIELLE